MPINQQTYINGIRGLMQHCEIDSLPRDYEGYKAMFHHARKLMEERIEMKAENEGKTND